MLRLKINRKSVLAAAVILVAIIAAGLYFLVFQEPLTIQSTNADTRKLLVGIKGSRLAEADGKGCDRGGEAGMCYQMHTTVFAIDMPGLNSYNTMVTNLNSQGWKRDGKDAFIKADPGNFKPESSVLSAADFNKQMGALEFSFLSPKLFGEQTWVKRGNEVLKFNAFVPESIKDRSQSDLLYILKSEVPGDYFDYKSVFLDYLQKNTGKMVIALSVSE